MKKSFCFLVLTGCILNLLFTVSCQDSMPTYEELKTAEKKIIKKIIEDKGIDVLKDYPTSGVFKENQFVELSSGVYLNVVDSGNGNRAVQGVTDLLVRASGEYYDIDDVLTPFNTFLNEYAPFEFKYGNAYYVVQERSGSYDNYYYYFSMALESVLEYVGENAVVKLIVPGYSEISGTAGGSTMQNGSGYKYTPIYYDRVKYVYY